MLYQLARAYETTGQPDAALTTLDRIVQRYPQSPQLDEVQFRRGELLFSAKRYPDAQHAYGAVIARGAGSAFYQQSLYKHGWSLFKQSESLESLPSFGGVLDQELGTSAAHARSLESLKRADRELVEDTLRVMSIAFSYNDGAASLEQYVHQHGERPYTWLLYSRLGDLYVDKQRYQDAATVYRAYVARDPYSDHAPDLDMAAIEAYGKGGFSQLVLDGKHEFVEHYNFDSPYWKTRSRADHARVVQELKTNLKDVATYFHANAQKTKSIADYQEAARWYRDYLKSFPDDADSAQTNYLLAEALFESHQYPEAASEYEHTAYGYPKNDKSATAAYAGLVAYQKGEEGLSGADKEALAQARHRCRASSSRRPSPSIPTAPACSRVPPRRSSRRAIARVPSACPSRSSRGSRRSIPPSSASPGPSSRRRTSTRATTTRRSRHSCRRATLAAGDDKLRADLTERLAASVYKQGEAKQKAGDAARAVEDYLRVARVAPDSKIRVNAQYDAATQLITLKQWPRAIGVLEDFRRAVPAEPAAAGGDAQARGGLRGRRSPRRGRRGVRAHRRQSGRGARGAARGAAAVGGPVRQGRQPPQGDRHAGEVRRREPRRRSPMPRRRASAWRTMRSKSGDTARRDHWYQEIVRADAQAGAQRTERTHYLAAKAQLVLAQPARDAFRAVRLTAPLKKSLIVKRNALETAMDGYKRAADYQVAEVTTAATYEMAGAVPHARQGSAGVGAAEESQGR